MYRSVASTSQGLSTNRVSNTITLPSGDSIPLLDHSRVRRKPFHRARPLWLVPFAIISSVVRGMTIAPRIEIYTQISCNDLYGRHDWNHTQHTPLVEPFSSYTTLFTAFDPFVPHHPATLRVHDVISDSAVVSDSLSRLGSRKSRGGKRTPSVCASDPEVQAGAARLQATMTTIMGLLSAVTSGWWGTFSERHGRTKVLAISTLGLLLTDLTFVLLSTYWFPHAHKLLVVAPVIEGLLGGLFTLQAATASYLSDCTPAGSRSQIFSHFTGIFYIGSFIGPSIAGHLFQHPFKLLGLGLPIGSSRIDLSPFWIAIFCSFVNLVMALFVFPESLKKEKWEKARWEDNKLGGDAKGKLRMAPPTHDDEVLLGIGSNPGAVIDYVVRADKDVSSSRGARGGIITQIFGPLAIFLPAMVATPGIARKRRDWSLTFLCIGLFAYTLSTGIFQMKFQYATHIYGWGVRKLSYYITFMGGLNSLVLLLLLPSIIAIFKPKHPVKGITSSRPIQSLKGKGPVITAQSTFGTSGKKPKFNRAQLGQEISFDITLARLSLLIDITAQCLVAIAPSPAIVSLTKPGCCDPSPILSEASFLVASALNTFGAGLTPSVHSLALSLTQLRALDGRNSGFGVNEDDSTGELFGALAALQAVGQTILAPMLFGIIYSSTVVKFPKAIFVISAILCLFALVMFSCVRNPVVKAGIFKGKAPIKRRRDLSDMPERGRSRVSKDLRGGAIPYNPRQSYGAVAEDV